MNGSDGYTIRTLRREEMPMLLDWAAAEGWNSGLHDGPCFRAADADGFLLGQLDGQPAATISVVKYGSEFAFLGFYIVRPELRGRGFGLRIWQAGMARLSGRVVGLDGVVAQQGNYRKSGFVLAWQNIRHEGIGGGSATLDKRVVPLSTVQVESVLAYDQEFFPAGRSAFLRCWITQPGSTALAFVDDGQVRGYGMIRPCRTGYKIGPLFADDAAIAESLFTALKANAAPTDKVYLDTPQTNTEAIALAQRHGMKPMFETARMYAGPAPTLPLPACSA
jgi:ribosomal protein S18 acetylase RimI-like enzyme